MPDTVLYQAADAIATITLNRPGSLNALTVEMKTGLLAALRRAATGPARAVILTGNGKGFCAGQDLREHGALLESGVPPTDTVREHYNPIITEIVTMPKPVIAAVNGVAAGAGAGLALACDFRIAAEAASLVMSFSAVGLGPDTGVSWTLQHLAGIGRAAELLMLAEPVPADRALALGLVTSVVPADDLSQAALDLAQRLAAGPTASYAAIKKALISAADHPISVALEREAELQAKLGQTADHRAATMAFLRKERPSFEGR
jgi:2-(1,2-epoxy-1,2-dihydrophenyl)acetyl-CoA isomerase